MRGGKAFGIGKSWLFPQWLNVYRSKVEHLRHKHASKMMLHWGNQNATAAWPTRVDVGCLNYKSAQQSVHFSFAIVMAVANIFFACCIWHFHRLPNLVKARPTHSHLFIGSECWRGGTGTGTGTLSLLRGPEGGVGDAQPRGRLETNVVGLRLLEKSISVICAKTVCFSMGVWAFLWWL